MIPTNVIGALSAQSIQLLVVVAPILALAGAAITFLKVLKNRDGEIEPFELGVFYAGVVFLYSFFPLVAYLSGGMNFRVSQTPDYFCPDPCPRK